MYNVYPKTWKNSKYLANGKYVFFEEDYTVKKIDFNKPLAVSVNAVTQCGLDFFLRNPAGK